MADDDCDNSHHSSTNQELFDMSFQERAKLQQSTSTRRTGSAVKLERRRANIKANGKKKFGPLEMSSKIPPKKQRKTFLEQVPKHANRDPRFDNLSGEFDEAEFERRYSFLQKLKEREFMEVSDLYEKEEDPANKAKIKDLLQRMKQQKEADEDKKLERKVEDMLKKERNEAIKNDRAPHFLSDAEKKKLVLAEKFKKLKETDNLNKKMNKMKSKSKHKDSKDKKIQFRRKK